MTSAFTYTHNYTKDKDMTDIIDDQRAAIQNLDEWAEERGPNDVLAKDWWSARALLPSALTDTRPVIPTEPGFYHSPDDGGVVFELAANHQWWFGGQRAEVEYVTLCLPLTRLVPERAPIGREDVRAKIHQLVGAWPAEHIIDAATALANGDDRA